MRPLRSLLYAAAATLALSAPAFADDVWGDGVEVMAHEEMGALRGGIAIRPGLDVNFGANITTFVNGAPALTTQLTWTDDGQFIEHSAGQIGARIDDLSPETRAALGVDGLENVGGVVIEDAQGVTALVHNIAEGALQNIIVNTASGRELRQETDITLTLTGFEAVQDSILLDRIGIRLNEDLRAVNFGSTAN